MSSAVVNVGGPAVELGQVGGPPPRPDLLTTQVTPPEDSNRVSGDRYRLGVAAGL